MIPRRVTFPFKNFTHDSSRAFAATSRSIYGGLSLNIKFVIYGEVCGFLSPLSHLSKKREPKIQRPTVSWQKSLPPRKVEKGGGGCFLSFYMCTFGPSSGWILCTLPGTQVPSTMNVGQTVRKRKELSIDSKADPKLDDTHTETHTNSHRPSKGWLRLSEWITVSVSVCAICVQWLGGWRVLGLDLSPARL